MRTVLILAHQCTPFERPASRAGAQRVFQFAKHLPAAGWRAEVLCCPEDPDDAGQICELSGGSTVHALAPAIAEAPLEALRRRAQERWSSGPALVARRAITLLALVRHGDWSSPWRAGALRTGAERVAQGLGGDRPPVDVIMGEHSPDAGMLAAADLGAASGIPYVLDFRDPLLSPFTGAVANMAARRTYRRAVEGAKALTNVQQEWAEADRRMFGRPSFCIPHGYDTDEIPPLGARRTLATFQVAIYGGLYPMYEYRPLADGLRRFIEARSGVERELVAVRYWGANAEVARHELRHVSAHLVATDSVPKTTLIDHLRRSAVVLVPTVPPGRIAGAHGAGLVPSKLIELLPVGVEVVAAPGDGGPLDRFARQTGVAVICPSADAVAARLEDLWLSWRASGAGSSPVIDPAALASYTRQRAAERMADVLAFAAGDAPKADP